MPDPNELSGETRRYPKVEDVPPKDTADSKAAAKGKSANTSGAKKEKKEDRMIEGKPITASTKDPQADPDAQPWSIILQTGAPKFEAIGVNVQGLVVIGRSDPKGDVQPDLDLAPYEAANHGVSRRHAIFMPTKQGLSLIDLDSTNGTWLNGISLKAGQRYRVRTGDSIEFGTLHLDVRLVGSVPTGQDSESTMITRTKPKPKE